jgi:hypothetical protein
MAETCITNWSLIMKTVVNDKLCVYLRIHNGMYKAK